MKGKQRNVIIVIAGKISASDISLCKMECTVYFYQKGAKILTSYSLHESANTMYTEQKQNYEALTVFPSFKFTTSKSEQVHVMYFACVVCHSHTHTHTHTHTCASIKGVDCTAHALVNM